MLLPFVTKGLRQTLQRAVTCSTSVAANPNQFKTTEDTIPFFFLNKRFALISTSHVVAAFVLLYSLWFVRTSVKEIRERGKLQKLLWTKGAS